MFFQTKIKVAAGAGLSMAWLALMAGAALAQDEVVDPTDGDGTEIIAIEDGSDPASGGDWTDDGTGGDGQTVYDDPGAIPVDSECGGCEYWTAADGGGRPVAENFRGDDVIAVSQGWETRNGPDLFARDNICLDADLYVGWLCDWQRPFVDVARP